jgi:hypothetical protein
VDPGLLNANQDVKHGSTYTRLDELHEVHGELMHDDLTSVLSLEWRDGISCLRGCCHLCGALDAMCVQTLVCYQCACCRTYMGQLHT